ncbi:MAG: 2-polyprenyl-6-methoxyphenol hydroxylase-like FAD-dependent oxidoreductase [Akkermansiaceae bacterium]|jgi:2-polyprenyl-6-methoxyphenol hydroxylase-like FAD-dependent oxidoreductase
MPYRIAIVGSGTAGPAAGILLARAGHEVTIFERAGEELAVGAGFLLQPTGLAVLRELGLEEEVLAVTQKIGGLYCETQRGKVLLDLDYEELQNGLFGLGTHRPSFLAILLKAFRDAGGEMRWGVEMTEMSLSREGRTLATKEGAKEGPFDLVLVCDGARSQLRGQAGIPARVDRYPWGALWFIGKRTPEFDPSLLWQKVGSTRELCGFLPTGTKEDLLSLFWSVPLDEPLPELDEWKETLLKLVPQAERFLGQVESSAQLQRASYHDVRMKKWHGERVAILGDAAHALSPQLGQGVNLALVDASVLAECLGRYGLPEALERFTRRRKKHVRFYQFATRWTTPFFQSDYLTLGNVRDLTFPIGMKVPYVRREMVRSMAGMKTGAFSKLPLE